ncbi:MAG: PAS domain S-box protein [Nitrospirae bacterium]|nr:PAS domain S-box protein [Nitrospirota bacterium]
MKKELLLFRNLVNQLNDLIFIADPETGIFLDVNDSACKVLGYEHGELLHMRVRDIATSIPDEASWKNHVTEARKAGHTVFEGRTRRKNGTTLPVEVNVNHVEIGDKSYMVAVVRDITERRLADDALRGNEKMLRDVTSSLAEGIYGMNQQGEITFMNPEAERLLGWTIQELIGRNAHDVVHCRKADGSLLPFDECKIHNVFKSGVRVVSSDEVFVRKDGTIFPISVISSPVLENGRVVAAVTAFRDITERRQIEKDRERLIFELGISNRELEHEIEERRQAEEKIRLLNEDLERHIIERTAQLETINRQLQEEMASRQEKERLLFQQSRMAAMGEMIGAIAHQWRQPLNVIGLIVQNLKMAYDYGELDSERFKNAVATAMWQIKFMSKTIDDFRNFFKPSKEKEVFDLKKAVEETISLIKAQLQNHYIDIDIVADREGLAINGYPNEFKHVLLNLINNAKDAILQRKSKENCEARITIELSVMDHKTILNVRDTGGGIPDAIIDRIFDPYFTTKEEGSGTGIGLYISKTMIERNMGGQLTARNYKDGAEFRIEV